MNLNEKLGALRKGRGLSQEAVADALGVSRQAVSKWETGRSYPDTENLIRLSHLFDVSADALIRPQSAGTPLQPDRDGGCGGASRSSSGKGGMLVALSSVVVVIAAAVIVVLKVGITGQPAPVADITTPTSIAMSEPSAEPPDGAAPPVSPAEPSDARTVYKAFITVTGASASAAERYEGRLTVYSGLRTLDWAHYEACGEAGKNTDTRMELLNWLAGQEALTAEELSGLISGMNNKEIDGAYCEPYAQALSSALIAYPTEFVRCLSALEDSSFARRVVALTIYGAAYEHLGETSAAIGDAMHSGTLSEAEYTWAVSLLERCADPYGEKAAATAAAVAENS